MRAQIQKLVDNTKFQNFIMVIILINAVTLGMETMKGLSQTTINILHLIDNVALSIFVIELFMKLMAYGFTFFKRSWCIFDFIIVAVSLVPAGGNLSVIRSLRVLRVLRLISTMPRLRLVVNSFLDSLPGVGAVGLLFSVIFYVFSVMSVQMFGAEFPQYFESISTSMFTLFQLITLEGWIEVVQSIDHVYPWATAYFILYILISTFVLLNMIIAVIVNVMGEEEKVTHAEEFKVILKELKSLKAEVKKLKK